MDEMTKLKAEANDCINAIEVAKMKLSAINQKIGELMEVKEIKVEEPSGT